MTGKGRDRDYKMADDMMDAGNSKRVMKLIGGGVKDEEVSEVSERLHQ